MIASPSAYPLGRRRDSGKIPENVKRAAEQAIAEFNVATYKETGHVYLPRFCGLYLYVDLSAYGEVGPVFRLKYNGGMDNRDFALYKYSREAYDPEEWFFPGAECVDGTIEGALKAVMRAYP